MSRCPGSDWGLGFLKHTVVNGEKALGVISVFFVFSWHIPGQEVQGLVSTMSRHLLTCDHLQQGKQDILQVPTGVCQSSDKSSLNFYHSKIHCKLVQMITIFICMFICSAALSYRVRGPLLCHNFSGLLQWESHRHTGTGLQLPEQSPHCPQPWCCRVCWFPPCGWWQLPLKHKHIINTNIYKLKATNTENCRTAPGITLPLRPHEIKMGCLLYFYYFIIFFYCIIYCLYLFSVKIKSRKNIYIYI